MTVDIAAGCSLGIERFIAEVFCGRSVDHFNDGLERSESFLII